jgi:LacI family transcriptional regulator
VINNYPYVKKSTRTKILKLLQEYNYVPNETARSLVNKASRMIGIFISDIRTTHHTDAIYYLESEFSKNGYSCLIYNTGADSENVAESMYQLSQRKVDGVVMIGSIYQNQPVKDAITAYISDVPVVIINGFLEGENIYGIISDEQQGIFNCIKLLADKGKKHPAIIVNNITPSNLNKVEGYRTGLKTYLPNSEEVIVVNPSNHAIYEETVKLLKNKIKVDSIIYTEDFLALIGLQALHDNHVRIPQDVAVIGVNNSRYSEISIPKLTSLDNMLYDTSITAVRNMLSLLKGERVNRKMMICSEIIKRQTT